MHTKYDNSIFPQAAEEIEALRDQQLRERNQMMKNNIQKMYQELVQKGNHNGFPFKSMNNCSHLGLPTHFHCSVLLGR